MDETPLYMPNPWTEDDRSLGTIRNVLLLAQRTGHLKTAADTDDTKLVDEARAKSPSLKLITLLKEIENRKKEVNKTSLQIQCRLQDKETKDLTHTDILDAKVKRLEELNSHLQRVVSHKDQLIGRLQQPFVGDFLKIDATYHKYVSELFPQVAPVLGELASQLDTIDWASNVDMQDGQLDNILSDISSSLATLQSRFQAICRLREALGQIHAEDRVVV